MLRVSRARRGWSAVIVGFMVATMAVIVPTASAQTVGPCTFPAGGDWFAVTCWGSTEPLSYESEEYAVPSNPTASGANFALWGGMEDAGGDTVLQGVLSWDGSSWSMYPEYWYANGKDLQGTHVPVKAGDTIYSELEAYNCTSAGLCTWAETIVDLSNDTGSSQTIGSGVSFTLLLGGVLEVHSASGCAELPASGHAVFRQIGALYLSGATVTPVFGASTPDKQCSMQKPLWSATSTDFLWTP